MITEIMVTCAIGSCVALTNDAMLRSKDLKEQFEFSKNVPDKIVQRTSDGYGYTITIKKERK